MGLSETYVRGVRSELGYWATWAPATHLELGDCGPVEDGIFRRETNIRDWGIEFEVDPNPVTGAWAFNSDKSADVTIQGSAGTQTIPQVGAGTAALSITFHDQEAIVLSAHGGNQTSIKNIHKLKKQLLAEGAKKGPDAFPIGFAVVTELLTADTTTVLVSRQRGGQYVVKAQADFTAGLADLANAALGISLAHSSHVQTELDAAKGATPLFRGVRLKRKWWLWLETSSLDDEPEQEFPFDDDPFGED